MGATDRIAGVVNSLTDRGWVWWPLVSLRPERAEAFSPRLALRLSLAVTVPAAAIALVLSALQVALSDKRVSAIDPIGFLGGAIGAFLAVWATYLFLLSLGAICWNRRAAQLRAGTEGVREKGADRHEWRVLVVASVTGWAIFESAGLSIGWLGLVILGLVQWLTIRRRWNVPFGWLGLLFFCLSLGVMLGDLAGGSIQNLSEGISWPSAGVEYLGPDRSATGYLMGQIVAGACVGALYALAQWTAVRSSIVRAFGSFLINVVGMSVAAGVAAAVHAIVQRTLVGVHLQGFLGGMSAVLGWTPATTDLVAWGLLVASAALLAGIIAGNAMGRSFANYASDVGPGDRWLNQRTVVSFVFAAVAMLAIVLSVRLEQWYPLTAGTEPLSGPVVAIMIFTLGWIVLGPAALVTGIRALRSAAVREGQETGRWLAWTGVVAGAVVLCLLIPILVLLVLGGDFSRALPGGAH